MNMVLTISLLVVAQGLEFGYKSDQKFEVEVQQGPDEYLVHFVANANGIAGRTGLATVRAVQPETPVGPKIHLATKRFDVETNNEWWEFYLTVPKFSDTGSPVVFQAELAVEPTQARSLLGNSVAIGPEITDYFTWTVQGDELRALGPEDRYRVQDYILNVLTRSVSISSAPVPSKASPVAGLGLDGTGPRDVVMVSRKIDGDPKSSVRLTANPPDTTQQGPGLVTDLELPEGDGDRTLHRFYAESLTYSDSPPPLPSKSP